MFNFELYGDQYCAYTIDSNNKGKVKVFCSKITENGLSKIENTTEKNLIDKIIKGLIGEDIVDDEKITVLDEDGIEREAKVLNILTIGEQEYIIYAISANDDEDGIYAEKLIKDINGNEQIIPITDEEEKKIVFETIKEMLDNLG